MKKLTFLAVFLALVVLLCGCKPNSNVIIINDTGLNFSEIEEVGNDTTTVTEPEDKVKDEIVPEKIVNEGDLVSFPNLKAVDPDGDAVTYTFSAPLDKSGKWQTEKGDAGTYTVTITASDGKMETSIDVVILVKSKNRVPVIEDIADITTFEGETVTFNPVVSDADNDNIVITYSGWMTSSSYTATYKDAGVYTVTINASDGLTTVSQDVKVTVKNVNRAPILNEVADVTVNEGKIAKPIYFATDLDRDELKYTFSEPLDVNGEWQTKVGDAGTYKVIIRVSDGEMEDKRVFNITVKSLNKEPVLDAIGSKIANAGKEFTFVITAADPEDDTLTYSAAGLPEGAVFDENTATFTWTPKESDGGVEYQVTFIVSDSKLTDSETVTITVNRAPVFQWG